MSVQEAHHIVSKREIEQRKQSKKILYENALIIQKIVDVQKGKRVSYAPDLVLERYSKFSITF